jgi:hypothetical protein
MPIAGANAQLLRSSDGRSEVFGLIEKLRFFFENRNVAEGVL